MRSLRPAHPFLPAVERDKKTQATGRAFDNDPGRAGGFPDAVRNRAHAVRQSLAGVSLEGRQPEVKEKFRALAGLVEAIENNRPTGKTGMRVTAGTLLKHLADIGFVSNSEGSSVYYTDGHFTGGSVYAGDVVIKDGGDGKYFYDVTRLHKNTALTLSANSNWELFDPRQRTSENGRTSWRARLIGNQAESQENVKGENGESSFRPQKPGAGGTGRLFPPEEWRDVRMNEWTAGNGKRRYDVVRFRLQSASAHAKLVAP